MGIINRLKNKRKFDAVEYVDDEFIFSVGKQKDGKYSLMKNDKIIKEDLDFVSMNLRTKDVGENREFFYAMQNGVLFLYSWFGEELTPNGLLTGKDYLNISGYEAERYSESEICLKNYATGHIVTPQQIFIYPKKRKITEPFEKVEYFGREKRVTAERTGEKYYLDKEGNQTSARFEDEGNQNKYGISVVTMFTKRHEKRQVLWDKKHKLLSRLCFEMKEIDIGFLGEMFLLRSKDGSIVHFLYDQNGKEYERAVESVSCLGKSGAVLKLADGGYHLVDGDCSFVTEADWFFMDKWRGFILFRKDDDYHIVGRDFSKIFQVNGDVARLMINKIAGRVEFEMGNKVIASHEDIETTAMAFDVILEDNKKYVEKHEKTQIAGINNAKNVLYSLKRAKLARAKKCDKKDAMCELFIKTTSNKNQDDDEIEITPIEKE